MYSPIWLKPVNYQVAQCRLIDIIIIQTSIRSPSEKNKIIFASPQAHAPRKTEENTTQGRSFNRIQRSSVKYSAWKAIPRTNRAGRKHAYINVNLEHNTFLKLRIYLFLHTILL